ncbi:7009_t:CDS:2 [Ambispora leptoticha]|uniref:7009_t:CDS:1 n=1 Tax=Ambispora leptoticha TaxID=144679 RepID=A0A9N9D0H9_9GLOM|nr:7009_t:CDS:2 [Ambispora leptoticha]
MKSSIQNSLVILLAVIWVFTSQTFVAADSTNLKDCFNGTFDPNQDYFPEKITVKNAIYFTIKYSKNYKLLTNTYTKENFALYQCGTPKPATTDLPAGTKIFSVPVKNVAVLDTTSNTYLELLGLRSYITYEDSSSASFVSSPCIQALENSTITALSGNSTQKTQDFQKVDLVIGAYSADNTTNNSVSTSAANDPGTLNRIEWLKFYAVFFNLEAKAENLTAQLDNNYSCLKNLATSKASSSQPLIAWAAYEAPSQYNNNTASWAITDGIYKKQLTEDAGAKYFNSTTLTFSTSADFLKAIENVDILIDETYIAPTYNDVLKNYGISSADNSTYKFVKNKQVYREDGLVNPNDGRDWLESAIVMEDAVLEDVMNVINSNLPVSGYNRIWLRNVATNEPQKVSSAANCTDSKATITSRAVTCPAGGANNNNTSTSKNTSGNTSDKTYHFDLITSITAALFASMFSIMMI